LQSSGNGSKIAMNSRTRTHATTDVLAAAKALGKERHVAVKSPGPARGLQHQSVGRGTQIARLKQPAAETTSRAAKEVGG
jgi:hypothetical protein